MGCFSACFWRSSNRHSKTKKPNETKDFDQKIGPTTEAQIADPLKINAVIEDENEEQQNSSARKKIAFDSNVKIHEVECENQLAGREKRKESGTRKQSKNELRAFLCSSEKEEQKTEEEQSKEQADTFSDSREKEKSEEEKGEGGEGKDQANILSDSSEKQKPEEKKTKREQGKDRADILSDSSQSSLFTYPPNNRYKNYSISDDECEDTVLNKCNLVDEVFSNYKDKDGHEGSMLQGESSESLFSLSIDSRKQSYAHEIGDKEVSSPFKPCDAMNNQNARDRTKYVDSVLNPIENLGQWNAVRAKTTSSLKNQEKENVSNGEEFTMAFGGKENLNLENEFILPFSEDPTLKQSKRISNRPIDDDIAVDTSLSSWLIESEGTPIKDNSPCSIGNSSSKRTKSPKCLEDRPILGALILEELKQMSRHSSPRRSQSFSPDETPIIGTVGSYWRHTGQAADAELGSFCKGKSSESSKCRKGKTNTHFRPFQTQLDKAMNSVAAEV